MDNGQNGRRCDHEAAEFVRIGVERRDEAFVERLLASPEALLLPVWRDMVLVREELLPCPVLLELPRLSPLPELPVLMREPLLLGTWHDRPVFAVELPPGDGGMPADLGVWRELRSLFPLIASEELSMLGYAKSMIAWRTRNRFCGVCGSPTDQAEAGHVRRCLNPACGTLHYPRTDPAVIVLVTRGEEALLVRQKDWPDRMHALVAGFVEPGETVEETVAREALEETSLVLDGIRYFGSKPWPFPGSIMLAFVAEAVAGSLSFADKELEGGLFISRAGLRQALEQGRLRLPSRHSMAYPLIENWYDSGDQGPLLPLNPY